MGNRKKMTNQLKIQIQKKKYKPKIFKETEAVITQK